MPTNPELERELRLWTLKGLHKKNFRRIFPAVIEMHYVEAVKKLLKGVKFFASGQGQLMNVEKVEKIFK